MSYRDPGGTKIQIALGLLPATDQQHKLGTIFYNPGGPGQSGRFAPALTPTLHERFDIVGFDPRGVGASTPIRCFTDPAETATLQRVFGTFPFTPADVPQHLRDARTITDLCGRNAGPLLGHLSTANVARDLDRLRAAVGEPKLRYYGKSYGTVLGEVYANLFPQRVGKLALDAVDDPVNWATGYRPQDANVPVSVRLGGFYGTQAALQAFFAACQADSRCVFREPGTDPMARFTKILDSLPNGTYQGAIARIHQYLTDADNSPALATYLRGLESHAMATQTVPTQFDSLLGGGGTICEDTANPTDQWAWPRYAAHADRAVRGFGAHDAYISIPCATWPVSDPDRYRGPWDHPTAPILLLANRQGDPETPYDGAQRAAKLLVNARLLTLDTFGHGSLGKSACVDAALDNYILNGQLPERGAVCQPDHGPFD